MKPIAVDLFCGAGGMSEGMLQAGFHIAYSNDINPQVGETYQKRHAQLGLIQGIHTHFECCDIRELNGSTILETIKNLPVYRQSADIEIAALCGGPPCQGFSRAGLRLQNDPRNFLFREYMRLVQELQPRYVLMENVEGMADTTLVDYVSVQGATFMGECNVIDIIKQELTDIGYGYLEPRILNAAQYGVPQKRKRFIFMAYRLDQPIPTYPTPNGQIVTVGDALRGIYDTNSSTYAEDRKRGVLKSSNAQLQNTEKSAHAPAIQERFSLFQQGETQRQLRERILSEGINLQNTPHLLALLQSQRYPNLSASEVMQQMRNPAHITQADVDVLITKKNTRTRLSLAQPAPTMLSSGDDYIHPTENRGLTVREMARLQSFDDSFVFQGKRTTGGALRKIDVPQFTQVGNAVPPLLARALALEIMKVLEGVNHDVTNVQTVNTA